MDDSYSWGSCIDWLVRCDLLPKDHWLTSGSAQPKDVAHLLRDGVLLCHLLNRLYPSAVDPRDFSQRPQMSQFLCLKNSRVFIQACNTVFKMKNDDLFEPSSLFVWSEYGKVLRTLSLLSTTPLAQRSGILPFTITANKDTTYYKNMKDLDDDGDDDDDDDDDYVYTDGFDDDKIYGCLVDMIKTTPKSSVPKTKREMCIQELVETEKKYVDVLETIKTQFMKPLRDTKDRTSDKIQVSDYEVIFFGIEKLWAIHVEFRANLLRACDGSSSSSTISIPDCFIICKEKLLFYGEFCANLTLAQETLDKLLLNNPSLKSKVADLELVANEGRFKLRDLLSIPMQRVLKYHLLLRELIKNTEEGHLDRRSLERALEETQDLSLFVNEVKRDRETLGAIKLLSSSIVGLPKSTVLEDNGRLLMDGELKVKCSSETGIQSRHLFLFDKVLLMCKANKGETYSYKGALVLTYYEVDANIKKEKGQYAFTLSEKQEKKECYTIYAKKEEILKKWIDGIKLAQDNVCPQFAHNIKHEFAISTFTKPTICDVCRKLLRGVFLQGYQCKKTNMNVHKECLKEAANMDGPPTGTILPPKRLTPQRVQSLRSPGAPRGKLMRTVGRYGGVPSPGGGRHPLTFDVGETVDVVADDNSEFLEGELNGRQGFFPRTAVWNLNASVGAQNHGRARSTSSTAHNYLNQTALDELEMAVYSWYAGLMSREEAVAKLQPMANGTFLVRVSNSASNKGEFAISMKFDNNIKHMKVARNPEGHFFLGTSKQFNSLQTLIQFYQQVTLERLFPEMQTVLAIPFKDVNNPSSTTSPTNRRGRQIVGVCEALYDYSATAPTFLSLTQGDRIAILSKSDEGRGWWKGETRGKIGFFPISYVQEIDNP